MLKAYLPQLTAGDYVPQKSPLVAAAALVVVAVVAAVVVVAGVKVMFV